MTPGSNPNRFVLTLHWSRAACAAALGLALSGAKGMAQAFTSADEAVTYNQGTFVGAVNRLGYHDEAKLAATFTMNELCRDGYFPPAGEKGDGGGFNGIGARWVSRFVKDRNELATFEHRSQKNAEAAWQARRPSDKPNLAPLAAVYPGWLAIFLGFQQCRGGASSGPPVGTRQTRKLSLKSSPAAYCY